MNRLLCFTAHWCQPCKSMKNIIFKLENEYPDNVTNFNINSPNAVEPKAFYEITVVPTFLVIDSDGLEVDRHVGQTTYEHLLTMMEDE